MIKYLQESQRTAYRPRPPSLPDLFTVRMSWMSFEKHGKLQRSSRFPRKRILKSLLVTDRSTCFLFNPRCGRGFLAISSFPFLMSFCLTLGRCVKQVNRKGSGINISKKAIALVSLDWYCGFFGANKCQLFIHPPLRMAVDVHIIHENSLAYPHVVETTVLLSINTWYKTW